MSPQSSDAYVRPSGTPPFWEPGTEIYWHYRRAGWQPGVPEFVDPMRVVRDDGDGLVAWLAAATPILSVVLADGRGLREADADRLFTAERAQMRTAWRGNGIIRIAPTGMPWSVWIFWADDGSPDGWYVNLEDAHTRDDRHVYSQDHVLDVDMDADRSYHRKDEDELVEAVRQGRYTAAEAGEFERHATDVEAIIDRWGSPFCDGWENWRPDPAWEPPGLPADATWDFEGQG